MEQGEVNGLLIYYDLRYFSINPLTDAKDGQICNILGNEKLPFLSGSDPCDQISPDRIGISHFLSANRHFNLGLCHRIGGRGIL